MKIISIKACVRTKYICRGHDDEGRIASLSTTVGPNTPQRYKCSDLIDFYMVYTQNPHHVANKLRVHYVEKYCENEQDLCTLAFSKKYSLKEK